MNKKDKERGLDRFISVSKGSKITKPRQKKNSREAQRLLNINFKNIRACCNGQRNKAGMSAPNEIVIGDTIFDMSNMSAERRNEICKFHKELRKQRYRDIYLMCQNTWILSRRNVKDEMIIAECERRDAAAKVVIFALLMLANVLVFAIGLWLPYFRH